MYISGYSAGNLANSSTWSGSFITTEATNFNTLFASINSIGIGAVTTDVTGVSYYLDKVLRDDPLLEPVTGIQLQTRVCNQRKRLGKTTPDIP